MTASAKTVLSMNESEFTNLVRCLWLNPISPNLRRLAVEDLWRGNIVGFLCKAGNEHGIALVWHNREMLRRLDVYESALLGAFTGTRATNANYPLRMLKYMLNDAVRGKLRLCGDQLPGPGPFTVYRGVSGRGAARRVRGIHWSNGLEAACWFAMRPIYGRENPAIFRAVVNTDEVLVYTDERQEKEFLVLLAARNRPQPVRLLPETIARHADVFQNAMQERNARILTSLVAARPCQG